MTEEQRKIQKRRLETVSDEDWSAALERLASYITWKLRGRTKYGAHSEAELGMDAVDYYMREAYLKLAEYQWEWKAEHTLEEQLMRVASNLIQKREEKYRRNAVSSFTIQDSWLTESLDPEEERLLDVAYEIAEKAVKGDEELERLLEAIERCGTCTEVCEYLGVDKTELYNMRKRFIRRLKKFQDA